MKAILFVDDHEVLARLACEILQEEGYVAKAAYDGYEALAQLDREKFDLLVTDYCMPGMNGLELARLVREKAPDFPVIVVSGYSEMEGGGEVSAWIEKYHLFPDLLGKIELLLSEPPEGAKTELLKQA
jgi:CheY-like chemotaxis protein